MPIFIQTEGKKDRDRGQGDGAGLKKDRELVTCGETAMVGESHSSLQPHQIG